MISKINLRKKYQYLRNQLSLQEVFRCSETISQKILSSVHYANASVVFVYMAMLNEVNLESLIIEALSENKLVAIPKIESRRMTFYQLTHIDAVKLGHFNILEPISDAIISPCANDLVIVPGIVFDRRGYRIGYGGGYYDKFLGNLQRDIRTIGVCYDAQIVPELPKDNHDLPVQEIYTEKQVYHVDV